MPDDITRLKEALIKARKYIEDLCSCTSSRDDYKVYRCDHCDEFMHLAALPKHGNPDCSTRLMLLELDKALGEEVDR